MSADFWDPSSTGSEFMDKIWESELKGTFGGSDTGGPLILGNTFLNYVPF